MGWHITGLARGKRLGIDLSVSYLKCWRPSVLQLQWSGKSTRASSILLCITPLKVWGLSKTSHLSHVIPVVERWLVLIPEALQKSTPGNQKSSVCNLAVPDRGGREEGGLTEAPAGVPRCLVLQGWVKAGAQICQRRRCQQYLPTTCSPSQLGTRLRPC